MLLGLVSERRLKEVRAAATASFAKLGTGLR
jgi:hypothetical protein